MLEGAVLHHLGVRCPSLLVVPRHCRGPVTPTTMIETFVEDTLAIIAGAPLPRQEPQEPRPGSFWLSRSTRRRCVVLWCSQGRVCLSYDELRINARKVHHLADFVRLYSEAK
jgi:hypothetical protein